MPTCAVPICDADHARRHADGGPTSVANGQGLSTRCHHLRDLPGWSVTGSADELIWQIPTGHRYIGRPPPVFGWGSDPP